MVGHTARIAACAAVSSLRRLERGEKVERLRYGHGLNGKHVTRVSDDARELHAAVMPIET